MLNFRVIGKNYEISICFDQRPLQSAVYIFKKEIKADLEAKKRYMVRFTPRFTIFKLYIYRKSLLNLKKFPIFMMTDPYKLFNCVFVPAGKFNSAEFRTVYTL